MKSWIWVAVVSSYWLIISAQAQPPLPQTIEGYVFDCGTRIPVEGALIYAVNYSPNPAISGYDGFYSRPHDLSEPWLELIPPRGCHRLLEKSPFSDGCCLNLTPDISPPYLGLMSPTQYCLNISHPRFEFILYDHCHPVSLGWARLDGRELNHTITQVGNASIVKFDLQLEDGRYQIQLNATDTVCNHQLINHSFVIDTKAPELIAPGYVISFIRATQLKITVSDPNLLGIYLDGKMLGKSPGEHMLKLELNPGLNSFQLSALDCAGNQQQHLIQVLYAPPLLSPTPTPMPTPTPTFIPIPTPTPMLTPTPSPPLAPSPTPTPTPVPSPMVPEQIFPSPYIPVNLIRSPGLVIALLDNLQPGMEFKIPIQSFHVQSLSLIPALRISGNITISKAIPPIQASIPVLEYFQITAQIPPESLRDAWLEFSVPKSWLKLQGSSDAVLIRLNGNWSMLPTQLIDQDPDLKYYRARLGSFSYFGIAAMIPESRPAPGLEWAIWMIPLVCASGYLLWRYLKRS